MGETGLYFVHAKCFSNSLKSPHSCSCTCTDLWWCGYIEPLSLCIMFHKNSMLETYTTVWSLSCVGLPCKVSTSTTWPDLCWRRAACEVVHLFFYVEVQLPSNHYCHLQCQVLALMVYLGTVITNLYYTYVYTPRAPPEHLHLPLHSLYPSKHFPFQPQVGIIPTSPLFLW